MSFIYPQQFHNQFVRLQHIGGLIFFVWLRYRILIKEFGSQPHLRGHTRIRTEIDLNECKIDLNECKIDLNECKIDLNECKIDLNECQHFLKANLDESEIAPDISFTLSAVYLHSQDILGLRCRLYRHSIT